MENGECPPSSVWRVSSLSQLLENNTFWGKHKYCSAGERFIDCCLQQVLMARQMISQLNIAQLATLKWKIYLFPPKLESTIDPNSPKLLCVIVDDIKRLSWKQVWHFKAYNRLQAFSTIQGGMGVTGRPRSDVVMETYCKCYEVTQIERIYFDPIY